MANPNDEERPVMLTSEQRRKVRAALEIAFGDEEDDIARDMTEEEYQDLLGRFSENP